MDIILCVYTRGNECKIMHINYKYLIRALHNEYKNQKLEIKYIKSWLHIPAVTKCCLQQLQYVRRQKQNKKVTKHEAANNRILFEQTRKISSWSDITSTKDPSMVHTVKSLNKIKFLNNNCSTPSHALCSLHSRFMVELYNRGLLVQLNDYNCKFLSRWFTVFRLMNDEVHI